MDDAFELPVNYNGQELLFPSRMIRFGYTYKIEVDVNGTTVSFERDEERNFRAIVSPEKMDSNINVDLLNAIAESLENL